MRVRSIVFLIFGAASLLAQTMNNIGLAGAGYSIPQEGVTAAQGQVVTVSVFGFTTRLTKPLTASTIPLPNSLGAFSVVARQGQNEFPAPLIGVQQRACATFTATPGDCPILTSITLQVPFELFLPPIGSLAPIIASSLVFRENGNTVGSIPLQLAYDGIHILNTCDSVAQVLGRSAGPCLPVVAHADGKLVTAQNPAQPGEELVLYAFGLGPTNPPVKTGEAPSVPAPTARPIFGVTVNSPFLVAEPRPTLVARFPPPIFSGLIAGSVGLYQVNFVVTGFAFTPALTTNCLPSNSTVTLSGYNSSDAAGICVQP